MTEVDFEYYIQRCNDYLSNHGLDSISEGEKIVLINKLKEVQKKLEDSPTRGDLHTELTLAAVIYMSEKRGLKVPGASMLNIIRAKAALGCYGEGKKW